jgi:hypothetical protein
MQIFFGFVLGFIAGWFFIKAIIMYKTQQILKSIADTPLPEKEKKVVHINITRLKNRFYVYNNDTQAFLTQGASKAEITEDLQKRFPDTSFMANPSNLKEVGLNDIK